MAATSKRVVPSKLYAGVDGGVITLAGMLSEQSESELNSVVRKNLNSCSTSPERENNNYKKTCLIFKSKERWLFFLGSV